MKEEWGKRKQETRKQGQEAGKREFRFLLVLVEVSPSRRLGACWRHCCWVRTAFSSCGPSQMFFRSSMLCSVSSWVVFHPIFILSNLQRSRKIDKRQGNKEEWPGKSGETREQGQGREREEAIEEGKRRNRSKVRGTGGEETAT
jgi:hypothetical protein